MTPGLSKWSTLPATFPGRPFGAAVWVSCFRLVDGEHGRSCVRLAGSWLCLCSSSSNWPPCCPAAALWVLFVPWLCVWMGLLCGYILLYYSLLLSAVWCLVFLMCGYCWCAARTLVMFAASHHLACGWLSCYAVVVPAAVMHAHLLPAVCSRITGRLCGVLCLTQQYSLACTSLLVAAAVVCSDVVCSDPRTWVKDPVLPGPRTAAAVHWDSALL